MSRHARRTTTAVAAGAAVLTLLAGCGGSETSGSSGSSGSDATGAPSGEELDGDQLAAAIEEDQGVVDERTTVVAPVLAEALDGEVLGAYGNVEGCNGGSFDGATAYGYQVQGRLVGFRAGDLEAAAASVEEALTGEGWSDVEVTDTAPGRIGVGASDQGAQVDLTLSDELPGALFTVRGRCLPVTDDGRDAVTELSGSRPVIAKR